MIRFTTLNGYWREVHVYVFKDYNYELAEKLIIKLAPTGMVPTKKDTPHVPVTWEEIIRDTYDAYKLGASVVHVHARDEHGRPTHRKESNEEIIRGIREKCPDMIICSSTSGRVTSQIEHRAKVLDIATEMSSLTLGSLNFPKETCLNSLETIKTLAVMMRERNILPELEIFEAGFINTAKYLARKGVLLKPLHFNLLLGSLGSISADMRDLVYLVESLPEGSTWSATGIGRFQFQINVAAILMGGHVRVGLEDSIYSSYPRGELATNTQLVSRIVEVAKSLGRAIATPYEARTIMGLPHDE